MGRSGPEVIYDTKHRYAWKSSKEQSSKGWCDFTPSRPPNLHDGPRTGESLLDMNSEEMDIRTLLKDIQKLGTSNMSWKERKKHEDQKVVRLGGKPLKNQRMNLGVSKVFMKKQKRKEEKRLAEESIFARFTKTPREKETQKRRPEDRVLKSSEGHFKKGVLNVKHLLNSNPAKTKCNDIVRDDHKMGKGKKKGKDRGKGKKGNKRR